MSHVQPIGDADLLQACTFLNRALNPNMPIADWMAAFQHPWSTWKPNNGFMLLEQERVVGVLGAIYSDQAIKGTMERFCNLTSWMVEEGFRSESLSLMRAVLSQKGYHFTSFTPGAGIVDVYRGLRFQLLDSRQWMIPCLPWSASSAVVHTGSADIERVLGPEITKVFRDHLGLPGLVGVALGREDEWTLVLYRRRRRKKHRSIEVLHVSDRVAFARHHRALARHLSLRERALTFTVAARTLPCRPAWSLETSEPQARLLLSKTLGPDDVELIYSEVVALNPQEP